MFRRAEFSSSRPAALLPAGLPALPARPACLETSSHVSCSGQAHFSSFREAIKRTGRKVTQMHECLQRVIGLSKLGPTQ